MPRFQETQQFRQPFVVVVVLAVAVLVWGSFVQQIVRGRPVGDDPMPDWAMWLITVLMGVGLPIALLRWRLVTTVYDDRLEVQLWPLTHRVIPFPAIASASMRTYRPIREYGGWGIRGLGRNRAYNASGDQGVQLVLTNGDRVLIGSQRPAELLAALSDLAAG